MILALEMMDFIIVEKISFHKINEVSNEYKKKGQARAFYLTEDSIVANTNPDQRYHDCLPCLSSKEGTQGLLRSHCVSQFFSEVEPLECIYPKVAIYCFFLTVSYTVFRFTLQIYAINQINPNYN